MKKFTFLLLPALSAVMVACSSTGSPAPNKEASLVQSQEVSAEEASAEQAEPKDEASDAELAELMAQFPETKAERIITTSVPLAEMLHVLDIVPIGVPTSTNPLPEDFEEIDQIGSPMEPDLEVVTSLEPDLILGAASLQSTLDQKLKGFDFVPAYLPTDSFDDLKLSFKALGTYFEKEEEMNEVLTNLANKEKELIEKGEGQELPTVMLMIGTSDSFMLMNEKSYVGSLVDKLGADNIATSVLHAKDTYSPINMEEVVVADPDVILVLASGDHGASEDMFKKEVEKNDTWSQLSAYKNDRIHILDHDVFGVTSIMNAEQALTEISEYFYE